MRVGGGELAADGEERDAAQGPDDLKVAVDLVRVAGPGGDDGERHGPERALADARESAQQGQRRQRGAEDRCALGQQRQRDGDEADAPIGQPRQDGRDCDRGDGQGEELDEGDEAGVAFRQREPGHEPADHEGRHLRDQPADHLRGDRADHEGRRIASRRRIARDSGHGSAALLYSPAEASSRLARPVRHRPMDSVVGTRRVGPCPPPPSYLEPAPVLALPAAKVRRVGRPAAYFSGITSGPQLSSATKTARICAGSVALAFSAKRCSAPGGSNQVVPGP